MKTWRSEAACLGQAAELFELPDVDDPSEDEISVIRKNLLAGVEICNGCPVVGPCGADADGFDKMNTVRAGILPSGLETIGLGPIVAEVRPKREPKKPSPKKKRAAFVSETDPWILEQISLLPDSSHGDFCDYRHPVSSSAIASSGLSKDSRSRLGVDELGRCRRCKMRISKARTQQLRRSPSVVH